jgi:hypothetical protein
MPETTIVSILASSPAEFGAIADVSVIAASFAVATVVLVHALRRAIGTTLFAPLVWCSLSWATVAITVVLLCQTPRSVPSIRCDGLLLLAASTTLCPIISLLGAKRPQDRAWQFIVASFWFIAVWPVVQGSLLYAHEPIDIPNFWRWLYGAALLVEVINYWPTLFCSAVLIAACGQLLLFRIFWAGLQGPLSPGDVLPGVFLATIAAVWASLLRRWRNVRRAARNSGWDRLWLDFRDDYGLVWGVRVMERINALAASVGASVALDWKGFYFSESPSDQRDAPNWRRLAPAVGELAKLEPGIRSVLRRFVSDDWISTRLGVSPPDKPGNPTVSSATNAS